VERNVILLLDLDAVAGVREVDDEALRVRARLGDDRLPERPVRMFFGAEARPDGTPRRAPARRLDRGEQDEIVEVAVVDDDPVLRIDDLEKVGERLVRAEASESRIAEREDVRAVDRLVARERPARRDRIAASDPRVRVEDPERPVEFVRDDRRRVEVELGRARLAVVEELRERARDDLAVGLVDDQAAAVQRRRIPDAVVGRAAATGASAGGRGRARGRPRGEPAGSGRTRSPCYDDSGAGGRTLALVHPFAYRLANGSRLRVVR
jgi:hypothetical protein